MDFLGLAAALSAISGGAIDLVTAGWVLGAVLSGTMIFAAMVISSMVQSTSPVPLFAMTALGLGLSTLFGWFPIWMIFFVVVFCLLSIMGFLGTSGGSPS